MSISEPDLPTWIQFGSFSWISVLSKASHSHLADYVISAQ